MPSTSLHEQTKSSFSQGGIITGVLWNMTTYQLSTFIFQEGTISETYMETDKPLTGLKLLDVG